MIPDAYIEVRFRTTIEGGRKTPIIGDIYACPIFIDGEGYDCRLLIYGMKIDLGMPYEIPIKFLNRDLILPKLAIGKKIILWEGKDIADGKITKINY